MVLRPLTIVRHGRAVAHLAPVPNGSGATVKDLLNSHRPDVDWSADLRAVRSDLIVEERR